MEDSDVSNDHGDCGTTGPGESGVLRLAPTLYQIGQRCGSCGHGVDGCVEVEFLPCH